MIRRSIPLLLAISALSSCGNISRDEIAKLRLLDCTRLPADASNVRLEENNFLDAMQHIRFDTSYIAAHALAYKLTGQAPEFGATLYEGGPSWWPRPVPPDAEVSRYDNSDPSHPGRTVIVQRDGTRATMWISESETPSWRARPCDVKRFPFV